MAVKDQEALEERANDLAARGFNGIRLVLVALVPTLDPREAKLVYLLLHKHSLL